MYQGQKFHKQAQQCVLNLIEYFQNERLRGGPVDSVNAVQERVAKALKMDKRSIHKIQKRGKCVDEHPVAQSNVVSSPTKKGSKCKNVKSKVISSSEETAPSSWDVQPKIYAAKVNSPKEAISDDLEIVVFDSSRPGGKMAGDMAKKIQNGLERVLKEQAAGARTCPQFSHIFFSSELIKVGCMDAAGKPWLIAALAGLPENTNGNLKVMEASKMSLTMISFLVPNETIEGVLVIQSVLTSQNPSLGVNKWHLFRRTQRDNGVLLVLGVRKKELDVLKKRGKKIGYLFYTLDVKIHQVTDEGEVMDEPEKEIAGPTSS